MKARGISYILLIPILLLQVVYFTLGDFMIGKLLNLLEYRILIC